MDSHDIRWIQRFKHFNQALEQLRKAVELANIRILSDLEKQGMIQSFEYTHELAWNTIKDFLVDQGHHNLYGSKDSTREAFKNGLIQNGEVWMDMIKSRNLSSHTYNREVAEKIVQSIIKDYLTEFEKLLEVFKNIIEK